MEQIRWEMNWRSPGFLKLQRSWYRRLKADGFQDLETLSRRGGTLWPKEAQIKIRSIQSPGQYYRLAAFFLHDYRFESGLTKRIWAMHCEGVPYRDIAEALGVTRYRVEVTIQGLVRGAFKDYLETYDAEHAEPVTSPAETVE